MVTALVRIDWARALRFVAQAVLALGVQGAGAEEWRAIEAAGRPAEPVVAVAASSLTNFAMASGGVVRWWRDGLLGPPESAAFPGVRDVAFGPSGALWVGGAEGLWRWRPDGRPERRALRGDR